MEGEFEFLFTCVLNRFLGPLGSGAGQMKENTRSFLAISFLVCHRECAADN